VNSSFIWCITASRQTLHFGPVFVVTRSGGSGFLTENAFYEYNSGL